MDDIRPTSPEMDKADARDESRAVTVLELHQEVADGPDNQQLRDFTVSPDWEVVVVTNFGQGVNEQRYSIELMMWDHDRHQLLLIQGYEPR